MPTVKELEKKAAELRKTLAQIDSVTGRQSELASQRDLMSRKRKDARRVFPHKCSNEPRRDKALGDVFFFLKTYFPHKFYNDFTDDHRAIVAEILHRAKVGGDKAIAAPRGEGKTTIAECMIIYLLLLGLLKFPVIVAATGPHASRILENIKHEFEFNDLLFEDFPLVCCFIRDLEGAPQRAAKQTDENFVPTHIEWSREVCVLPTIEGSKASGAIIKTFGLDAAIRGVNHHGNRPDFVLIDDPETRESAASDYQIETREQIIDRDIAGLAGQGRALGRLTLCTLQNQKCLSAKLTDPKQKPSWGGSRYAMLKTKPENADLWEEYVQLVESGGETGTDPDARKAMEFYVTNRAAMDAGAEVSNPNRFIASKLGDGSQTEISALQHCYNIVARIGWANFLTEYQNDPPEEMGEVESGITPHRVQKQVNGYERRIVPPGCVKLTRGVDCGKALLHWVVRAWMPNGTGFTVDYGRFEVAGTTYGSDEGVDVALKKAILAYLDESKDYGYCLPNGEVLEIDRTLIDARWRTDAVYAACMGAGLGVQPVMGIGQSDGCVQANFNDVQRRTADKKPGDGWFLSRKGKLWLVLADTDRWKAWEHDRWMTSPDKPGCMSVFGMPSVPGERFSHDERDHHSYARHICNEIEIEEPYKGTTRRRWKAKGANHWLDASYYANVAANMEGIRLPGQSASRLANVIAPANRLTLSQMAGKA